MSLKFYTSNARWLATGLLLTFGSSIGQTWFISIFSAEIRMEFGLSDGEWGLLFMAATLASASVLVQVGPLADTLPLRRLAIGVVSVFAFAAMGLALAKSVLILAVCVFFLRFCGQGLMSHLSSVAMSRWFRANRGRAIATSMMGFSLGLAVLPPILVWLLTLFEWREVWMITAGTLIVVFLPVLVYLMSGNRTPSREGPSEFAAGLRGVHWQRREVVRHGVFWMLVLGMLASPFIGTAVFFNQIHIAEVRGWDLVQMAFGYSVFAFVTVVSGLITGNLIDKFGPMRLLPAYLLPMAVSMILIAVPGGEGMWTLALATLGVSTGMGSTIYGAIWPALYGTNHIGAIKALSGALMVFATAAGPGITGVLIDQGYSFPEQTPWLALWCVIVAAIFGVLGLRLHRRLAAS